MWPIQSCLMILLLVLSRVLYSSRSISSYDFHLSIPGSFSFLPHIFLMGIFVYISHNSSTKLKDLYQDTLHLLSSVIYFLLNPAWTAGYQLADNYWLTSFLVSGGLEPLNFCLHFASLGITGACPQALLGFIS